MTNVSSKELEGSVHKQITAQLADILSSSSRTKNKQLLEELLSDAELIMLAKRLAIVALLSENISAYKISQLLKVSPTTVSNIQHDVSGGEYKAVIRYFEAQKRREEFWDTVDNILRAGMPPMGKGRWKKVFAMMEEHRAQKQKKASS